MPVSTTRAALKSALASITANVYDHVPETIIPPACVLVPSSPYIEVQTIGKSQLHATLNFTITIVVAYHSNPAALDNLEQLYFQILAALPANYVVGVLERPSVTQVGASEMLVADFNVSTYYTN